MENSKEEKVPMYPIRLSKRQKKISKMLLQYKHRHGNYGKKPIQKEESLQSDEEKKHLAKVKQNIQKNKEIAAQKTKSKKALSERKSRPLVTQLPAPSPNGFLMEKGSKVRINANRTKSFLSVEEAQKIVMEGKLPPLLLKGDEGVIAGKPVKDKNEIKKGTRKDIVSGSTRGNYIVVNFKDKGLWEIDKNCLDMID